MSHKLAPGVIQEQPTSLNPKLEAYWVQKGDKHQRILVRGDRVDDGEIVWAEARLQSYVEATRSLLARLLGKEIEGAIFHPSGSQVKSDGSSRKEGNVFTVGRVGIDLRNEIARRVKPFDVSQLVKISDTKMFLPGGTPMRVHSVSSVPEQTRPRVTEGSVNIAKIQSLYQGALRGFKQNTELQRGLGEQGRDLRELQQFAESRVKWATLHQDGSMTAQESGNIGDAWMFVVPPGHEKTIDQTASLSMEWDRHGMNPYLSILPEEMTDRWAALGLVHELSHLRDAVLKIEPPDRTRDQYLEGEHKAYSVERALAMAFSNGRLQAALESVVNQALQKPDSTAALNSLMNEQLPSVAKVLDQTLEPSQPKSEAEAALRNGFYVIMLGFEIARQSSEGDPVRQKHIEKQFIEMIYEPTGHLPKA